MADINLIKNKFSETYNNFKWKHGSNESKSGEGSSLAWTENYRKELTNIIKTNNIVKILDCSCGDWNWMRTLSPELKDYTGVDIVPELIEKNKANYETDSIKFYCSDMLSFLSKSDEKYDLIICRHTFEHLPNDYVMQSMLEIKKKAKYCLFSSQEASNNTEIAFDGYVSRHINLKLTPYVELLGQPTYTFIDSPFNNGALKYTDVYSHLYYFEK